ncbi:hypothetical protein MAR_034178 [Mya arenaria]|uniref:Uncharacterized protein n=1 Tax=Mya arenaria TaxID=6604 RepID=A0ABY7GFD2_MYAAR|nr:uncharacterized protein LOC128223546 [Mya arenaria]WAR31636.1 hypothetical protein MAR_034178 [Mya arenaria]
MSWYSHMMRSQEIARGKNRREARRAENRRVGAEFVAQYRLAALDKEKKMIEKELERIRQGVHRPPKLDDRAKEKDKHVLTVTSPRYKQMNTQRKQYDDNEKSNAFVTQSINPVYSEDENKLYDAIVFLQNNPSALVPVLAAHAKSDAYLETLGRITPHLKSAQGENQPFVPRYLQDKATNTEKAVLLNKYTSLLHRSSPILRRSSPLRTRPSGGPLTNRESPLLQGEHAGNSSYRASAPLPHIENINTERTDDRTPRDGQADIPNGAQSLRNDGNVEKNLHTGTGNLSSPRRNKPKPLTDLTDSELKAARDKINHRLGNNADDIDMSTSDAAVTDTKSKADDKKSKPVPKAMFPAFDPDTYNPDGSLRTVHQMPEFDQRWEQAEKARYIRTKDLLDRDRELSVNEIFDKGDRSEQTKS